VNPVVIIHLLAAALVIGTSVPLMRGKVKMNAWYGMRIPAAFASDEAWLDINRYGGQLMFRWGWVIAATATSGAFLGQKAWISYNWTALVIIAGGLTLVIVKIYRYARAREKASR